MKQDVAPYLRKAQYHETDQMGVIHHANYIKWFEEARVDFLEKIGLPYARLESIGILIPVLGIGCDYISSVVFDETVVIHVSMPSFNGLRMTIDYRITGSATDALKATGQSRHCFADPTLKPIRLKRDHPEIFRKLEEFAE